MRRLYDDFLPRPAREKIAAPHFGALLKHLALAMVCVVRHHARELECLYQRF